MYIKIYNILEKMFDSMNKEDIIKLKGYLVYLIWDINSQVTVKDWYNSYYNLSIIINKHNIIRGDFIELNNILNKIPDDSPNKVDIKKLFNKAEPFIIQNEHIIDNILNKIKYRNTHFLYRITHSLIYPYKEIDKIGTLNDKASSFISEVRSKYLQNYKYTHIANKLVSSNRKYK